MHVELWEVPFYMVNKAHDLQLQFAFHLPFWGCTTSRSCFTVVLVLACPFSHVPLQAERVVGSGLPQIFLQWGHHNWVELPYIHQLALKGFEWCCDTNSHHFLPHCRFLCSVTHIFSSSLHLLSPGHHPFVPFPVISAIWTGKLFLQICPCIIMPPLVPSSSRISPLPAFFCYSYFSFLFFALKQSMSLNTKTRNLFCHFFSYI